MSQKDNINRNFSQGNCFYVYGNFDETIPDNIIRNLIMEIDKQAGMKEGVIKFFIDSNGGETRYVYNLISLIEKAKAQDIKIETYALGDVYSCGSLLAVSGTKGSRFVSKYTEHLCHMGSSIFESHTPLQLERLTAHTSRHFNKIKGIYEKYCNIPSLEEVLKDDAFFIHGEDLIKWKLADKFIDVDLDIKN